MRSVVMPLVVLFLAGGVEARAQPVPHVCGGGPGPNEVQAGVQPGGNGMAPTPLCYWKQDHKAQQASDPPEPTGWWEKTWGAIAPSPKGGVLGTALGASNREEAEQLALADCKAKGGVECEIELSYHNQCAVMTVGDKFLGSAHAASIERASEIGIAGCQRNDTNCRVYYSACTEPIFHQY